MCRISSRYPFPFPHCALRPYQIEDKRKRCSIHPSRAAAFFQMFLPSPTCTLVWLVQPFRVKVAVARSPRDLGRGHDPSLGAPMPGHHRVWPYCWSKPSALRAPVTGSQTPKLLPPITVTSRCAGSPSICAVLQTMSLFAGRAGASSGALYRTAPARRYHDLSSAAHPPPQRPKVTEHLISCQRMSNSIATCDLNCNDTC